MCRLIPGNVILNATAAPIIATGGRVKTSIVHWIYDFYLWLLLVSIVRLVLFIGSMTSTRGFYKLVMWVTSGGPLLALYVYPGKSR